MKVNLYYRNKKASDFLFNIHSDYSTKFIHYCITIVIVTVSNCIIIDYRQSLNKNLFSFSSLQMCSVVQSKCSLDGTTVSCYSTVWAQTSGHRSVPNRFCRSIMISCYYVSRLSSLTPLIR